MFINGVFAINKPEWIEAIGLKKGKKYKIENINDSDGSYLKLIETQKPIVPRT